MEEESCDGKNHLGVLKLLFFGAPIIFIVSLLLPQVRLLGHRVILSVGPEDARYWSLRQLARYGQEALPVVEMGLSDPSERLQRYTVRVLSEKGPAALPTVISVLNDSKPELVTEALQALYRMPASAASAAPELGRLLVSEDAVIRDYSALVLLKLGRNAAPARDHIIASLKSGPSYLKVKCIKILMNLDDAEAAIPALIEAFSDKHKYVWTAVEEALVALGQESIPALTKTLNHAHPGIREQARITLDKIHLKNKKKTLSTAK